MLNEYERKLAEGAPRTKRGRIIKAKKAYSDDEGEAPEKVRCANVQYCAPAHTRMFVGCAE